MTSQDATRTRHTDNHKRIYVDAVLAAGWYVKIAAILVQLRMPCKQI